MSKSQILLRLGIYSVGDQNCHIWLLLQVILAKFLICKHKLMPQGLPEEQNLTCLVFQTVHTQSKFSSAFLNQLLQIFMLIIGHRPS